MKVWFLVLVLFSTLTYSQKWELFIPIGSQHLLDNDYVIKETNPMCTGGWCAVATHVNNLNLGLILYRRLGKFKIGGGTYYNSVRRMSMILGGGYEFNNHFGIEGGIANNYNPESTTYGWDKIPIYFIYYKHKFVRLSVNQEVVNIGLTLSF